MTREQKEITRFVLQNGGTATKQQIVKALDSYYCNGEKHIGDRLSRMVKAGLIKRVKNGVFEIGDGRKPKPMTER